MVVIGVGECSTKKHSLKHVGKSEISGWPCYESDVLASSLMLDRYRESFKDRGGCF